MDNGTERHGTRETQSQRERHKTDRQITRKNKI